MGLISVTQTYSVVWVQAFFQPCDSCVHRYLGKDTQGSSTSSVCRGEDLGAELLKLHRFRRCKVSSSLTQSRKHEAPLTSTLRRGADKEVRSHNTSSNKVEKHSFL